MRWLVFLVIVMTLIPGCTYALDVHIQGRWQNGPEAVLISYVEDAATTEYTQLKSAIDRLSYRFEFNLDLDRAALVQLQDEFIIVQPGDTVDVHIAGSEGSATLRFEGPRRMHHSFLIRLKEAMGLFRHSNLAIDEHSIEKYKVAATRHYDSCILFLKNDATQKVITESFEKIAQAYLTTRYYSDLLYPLTVNKITKGQLPQYYFELVNFSFFKTTDLLGFREFVLVVSNYNTFYYADVSPNKYDDSVSVAARIRSANLNFFGEVKDHLLLFIFAGLTENGTEANAALIQTLYEYLAGVFNQEPKRIQRIHKMRHEYDIINKPLPPAILSQQLRTTKGKFISLKELLGSNQVIYFSFWASSCEPCIAEMQSQKQLMAELDGNSVKFLFISFDDDEKKWQKAIAKLKMKGVHYLISEGFESEFAKYISFHELPRYLIFDKQDRLISHEAQRPGSILKDKSVLLGLLE